MKKTFTQLVQTAALVIILGACASAPQTVLPGIQESLKLDGINRQTGYQFIADGSRIVFIYDPQLYKIEGATQVYLEGSFNGWLKGTDDAWLLEQTGKIWQLELDASAVRIPGNSGYPEFKFYVISGDRRFPREPNAVSTLSGYQMATNNLVLFPGDDPETVVANIATADTIRELAEFDLTDPAQAAVISNVRLVPGTTALYRGYHPFKKSRGQFDTEDTRIALVKKALEDNGIQSVITLSGDEKPGASETVSAYHQAIMESGRQLTINTSYNTVYFNSTGADFGSQLAQVVRFINAKPGPYYVHCRLGTDRTGVVSAVLAAFSGASWAEIAADYQKSNLMGIKEFRDYRLLQYSFEQMLGEPVSSVADLKAALAAYFIKGGYLSAAEIDAAALRLTGR